MCGTLCLKHLPVLCIALASFMSPLRGLLLLAMQVQLCRPSPLQPEMHFCDNGESHPGGSACAHCTCR